MNKRYVSQVLLATFGFGVILAVIAALQTPADRPQPGTGASRTLTESPLCHAADSSTPTPKATTPTDDFKDDCEFTDN